MSARKRGNISIGPFTGGRLPTVILTASLALSGCGVFGSTPAPTYKPDLSGTWILADSNDSTAFQLALGDSARRLPRSSGERGNSGMGRADTSYSVVGSRMLNPVRATQAAATAVGPAPSRLTIEATDSLVTFRFPVGEDVALATDWQQVTGIWSEQRPWELRARWYEGRLEVERRQPNGDRIKLEEYYSRSPGSDRLVVWTRISVPGDELSVRRVYRLAVSAASG